MKTLRSIIEEASERAEEIFNRHCAVPPAWIATNDEQMFILPMPCEDKDVACNLISSFFAVKKVSSYVFVAEAWCAEGVGKDNQPGKRAVKDLPGSIEVVVFTAENNLGDFLSASRKIVRPLGGKAYLEPLTIDSPKGIVEGRMVGMLRPAGRPH